MGHPHMQSKTMGLHILCPALKHGTEQKLKVAVVLVVAVLAVPVLIIVIHFTNKKLS